MDWGHFIAAISTVPATLWGVVIGSLLTSLGVWLTNRGVAKRFTRQLKHDEKQRRDEREFALRRDVYLAASDALSTGLMAITRYANLKIDDGEVTGPYVEKAPAVAKVHVVATIPTIKVVNRLTDELGAAYARLLVKRLPVRVQTTELESVRSSMAKYGAEAQRWVEVMQQENLQGRDENRSTWIRRNFDFEHARHLEAIEAEKRLSPATARSQLDLLEECAKEHLALLEFVTPVLVAIRTELGFGTDEAELQRVLGASVTRQEAIIATLSAELRAFADSLNNPAPAAALPDAAHD